MQSAGQIPDDALGQLSRIEWIWPHAPGAKVLCYLQKMSVSGEAGSVLRKTASSSVAGKAFTACLFIGLCLSVTNVVAQTSNEERKVRNVTPENIPVIILPPRNTPKSDTKGANDVPIPGDSTIARVLEDGIIQANGKPLILFGTTFLPGDALCENPTSGRWACGLRAYVTLRNFIHGKELKCETLAEQAGGTLARCFRDRINVSLWLVSEGWALYDTSASDPALEQAASEAKKKMRGIWVNGSEPVTARK